MKGKNPTAPEKQYMDNVRELEMFAKRKISYTWQNINHRCINPDNKSYSSYGGKGIKVEWVSCREFREDMLDLLIKAINFYGINTVLSIDRIKSKGNYSKDNCQWIPLSENCTKDSRGVKKSNAHKMAMSKERKGKPQTLARTKHLNNIIEDNQKAVCCIKKDGQTHKVFPSIREAADEIGCVSQNISEICNMTNPKRKTAGGYLWAFLVS